VIASVGVVLVMFITFGGLGLLAAQQAPPLVVHQATTDLTVKSSPSQDALVDVAKKNADVSKVINDLLQQARTALDVKNKPVMDAITAKSAKWQVKIDADTKDLKAQLKVNGDAATVEFQQKVGALQNQVAPVQTLQTLENIVKKEQGLPDNATFDEQRQVWTVPAKPEEKLVDKAEPKK
jgi:hypothetical protein